MTAARAPLRRKPHLGSLLIAVLLLSALPGSARSQARDEWLGTDKFAHFFLSFVITSASFTLARDRWDWDFDRARRFGAAIGLAAGIAKETFDGLSSRGRPSGKDLVWDLAGVGVGLVLINQVPREKSSGLMEGSAARFFFSPSRLDGLGSRLFNGIDRRGRMPKLRRPET